MITGWIDKENLHKLSRAEAVAFLHFLLMEEERHWEDIMQIRRMVKVVRVYFRIEVMELNGIYSKIKGEN